MIYKFANLGFKTVMSNSSAFYFDMTDDKDMENFWIELVVMSITGIPGEPIRRMYLQIITSIKNTVSLLNTLPKRKTKPIKKQIY